MRRQIKLKFLAQMLLTLVVLGVGVHFLHAFQVKRNAAAFLLRADEAEEEKDYAKSLNYLRRYLGFHPNDSETLARYALLLDKEAAPQARFRAFLVLEEAVRRNPDREDVRRRVISTAMALHRFGEAKEHLKMLQETRRDDVELEDLLGQCEEAGAEFKEARDRYENIINKLDPGRIDCYARLAWLHRRLKVGQDAKADAVMARLEQKPLSESLQARLALGAYFRDLYNLDKNITNLRKSHLHVSYAREHLAPDAADVLLLSAELAQRYENLEADRVQRKKFQEEARGYLKKGLKIHPEDLQFHFRLARLELGAGKKKDALDYLQKALKALKDRPELIWQTADLFLDAGEPEEAKKLLDRLSQEEWQLAANYLQARLLLFEDKTAAARTLLEQQRQGLAKFPDLARRADSFLAVCYERLGNPEKQLEAYRRAAAEASASPAVRLRLASALLANNKIDEAISEYGKLMPSSRLMVVRLRIVRNLQMPAARRNWDPVDDLLKEASPEDRDTVEYILLRAEMLVARDKVAEARALMETACQKTPKEVRCWLTLAALADRDEKAKGPKTFDDSFKVLDKAEKELGEVVELRLARASRFARMGGEQAKNALRKLEEKAEGFSQPQQAMLLVGLADAHQRLGDMEYSRRLLGKAAALLPQDLLVRLRLFDLARAAKDDAAALAMLKEIRTIEGDEGSLWRFAEAARLVGQALKGDKTGLDQARRRLAEVAKSRPNWSRVSLLKAEIDDLEGNQEAALENYQRALELGEQAPQAMSRAVQLLSARNRPDEVMKLMDRIQDRAVIPPELNRLAASVSMLSNEARKSALDLGVAEESKDYRDQLFRGQVLWSVNKRDDAEKAFREAVALEPKAPEAWAALVTFLAGTEQKKEAEAQIDKASRALPAEKAPLALVVCYEAVGQRKKAEELLIALQKEKPKDVAVLRAVAGFHLRGGEPKKADPYLRLIIGSPSSGTQETVRWARRSLAVALAADRDFQESRRALELIDENLREHPDSPEDQRARAIVLAAQPGGRRESIRVLESSYALQHPTPGEQVLLAQLYEANHEWDKANKHLLALVNSKGGDAPPYLAYYVRALLRQNKVPEAASYLARLKEKVGDPDPNPAQTKELTARVWARQGKGREAAEEITNFVEDEFKGKKEPEYLAGGARLLAELGQNGAAKPLFEKYVAAARAKKPESVLLLASFLARQGELSKTLDLCEEAWLNCKPEAVAIVCVNALLDGQPGEKDYQRVERWLKEALKQHPESQVLPMVLANLFVMLERLDDAEALYRSVHTRNPRSRTAMNNLAWLLAMHANKKEEGLELITRAIEIEGPSANLLDTRGMVQLISGKTEEAIKDLEDAVAEHPQGGVYFHLAQAYFQANNRSAAEQAWQKAKELKLSEKEVLRVERAAYRKLAAVFDQPK
jgi:cellulose synthase operon protein C